ncbi:MAG TPA: argininosuccinate lyase [Vicinamibacterales bacterium]|nr:argininosuccinate lyase [Vicinamibacterales bacterium]
MSTLWSGRFTSEPDKEVFDYGKSLSVDRRLVEDDIAGSQAWAEALGKAGAIDAADVRAIVRGLDEVREAVRANPALLQNASDEDVHSFVERELVARIGDAGKRLHTGRSRNEQVSVDTRRYLMRRIPHVQSAVAGLVRALADQAEQAGQTVVPSYTHLRRAQPVLAAHLWLAHAAAFRRDVDRLDAARREADVMPLGSGAIAGTAYDIDVHFLAQRLGFSRIVANSIDSSGDRDFVATFLYACAMTMIHLSRLAEDVIVLSSEEFGFLEVHDSVATGSSLMPQKKNPDPLELVRGKAGKAVGLLTGWLTTLKGLAHGYNKDLQEDKATLFDAEDMVIGCVQTTATVVRTLGFRADVARRAASGLLLATEVADYLVGRGLPFRTAHEVTGRIVRDLYESGKDFSALGLEDWRRYHETFDEGIFKAITPEAAVAARRTPQSTSPAAVAAQLADTRAWLGRQPTGHS